MNRITLSLIVVTLAVAVPPLTRGADPVPVPDAAARKQAEALVKDVFGAEIAKAKLPPDKAAVAEKLLKHGIETKDDPAARFVLFREARDLAAEAGAVPTALKAVDEMARSYQVNALDMKTDLLASAQRSPVGSQKAIVDAALALVGTAIEADNYEAAGRLAEVAVAAAKSARNPFLTQQATGTARTVQDLQKAFADAKPFVATLKDKPDDPMANLAVGKYLCFVKGQWAKGGPMLAKSNDPVLKRLAERELAALVALATPADTSEQREIGDAWWDLADATPAAHETLLRRAAFWYRQASPKLTGLTKAKIDKRLGEVDRLGKGGEAVGAKEPGGKVPNLAFANRVGGARERAVGTYGGNAASEKAVAAGLAWLARKQNTDGSWTFDGSSKETVAATGLALMAFVGNGDAPGSGTQYAKAVEAGAKFLAGKTKPDGEFGTTNMYAHGIATVALCEAAGMYADGPYRAQAAKAVGFILHAQGRNGSWGYTGPAPSEGDTSIVGWQVQPLMAARYAGLKVDGLAKALERADKFLDSMSTDGGARYGYRERGASQTLTPVGLLSRHAIGTLAADGNAFDSGAKFLMGFPPQKGYYDLYYYYYATRVMFLRGGDDWEKSWNPKMRDLLVDLQEKDGGWPKDSGFIGQSCGRVGTTALCLLTLEVYYRYPRAEKPAEK